MIGLELGAGSLVLPLALALELFVLLTPAYALARIAVRRWGFDPAATLVLAYALAAVAGYAAFWCYFASPQLGRAVSVVWAIAALVALRAIARGGVTRGELLQIALTFAAGTLYLAVLAMPAGPLDPEHRFFALRPNDDVLPQIFAEALYRGADPRAAFGGDWLSSDRPPLQAGLYLLLRPLFAIARLNDGRGYVVAGLAAQLAWLPATWLLCVRARFTPARLAFVLVLMLCSGYFLYDSVYAWPKLLAAGFCLASLAFALPAARDGRDASLVAAALCAALALLAHGSAIFFLLPALAVLLVARRLPFTRGLAAGVAVAVVLLAPWGAYQRFYDPPGDRLVKMHLAGIGERDPRSGLRAIADAYTQTPFAQIVANKLANLRTAAGGAPLLGSALTGEPADALDGWRVREREDVVAALGVVNLGWLALAWWWTRPPASARARAERRNATALAALAVLATLFWCAAMFGPGATVTTHGSYAVEAAFFIALAAALAELPRAARALVVAVAACETAVTWVVSSLPDAFRGARALDVAMVLLAVAAAAATGYLLLLIARGPGSGAPRASNPAAS
ncbi:MAG TPA: hypothetical protein VHT53_10290 [Candidatus Elarobacter sp.]|nr:hypothetical protein [Candidatus Elarobacter sp.]